MPRKYYKKARKPRKYRKRNRSQQLIPRSLESTYPSALRTKLIMNTAFPMTGTIGGSNNNATYAFFKLNSILNCGPSLQATTGTLPIAFSATFPSGINYLLSSATNTNALTSVRAPYGRFMVIGSSIVLKMSSIGNAHSTQVCIYPASNDFLVPGIGQSIENLGEQPLSRKGVVNSVTAAGPATIRSQCSTVKSFGLTRKLATNDDSFIGDYNNDPDLLATWVIGMNNLGSALIDSVFTVDVQATLTYDVIFFDRNLFGSAAPI